MLSKNRRQLIERLKTRKGRPREGLVLVEGVRASAEALAAGADIRFVVRSPRLLDTEAGRTLASALTGRELQTDGVDVTELTDVELADAELAELSDTEQPQGVLCVCSAGSAPRPRYCSWMGCRTPVTWAHSSGLPGPLVWTR